MGGGRGEGRKGKRGEALGGGFVRGLLLTCSAAAEVAAGGQCGCGRGRGREKELWAGVWARKGVVGGKAWVGNVSVGGKSGCGRECGREM